MANNVEHNPYPGVNAHLNSLLQNEPGGWESFHSEHIIDLVRGIDAVLPAGYIARADKSLQISEISSAPTPSHSKLKPDGTIYETSHRRAHALPIAPQATAPTSTVAIPDTLTEEAYLTSAAIYQAGEGGVMGRPIARIELLSPANKPSGSHYSIYTVKRLETLRSGLRLVEIDYLHETHPIIPVLKSYPRHEEDAYPYTILVTDPRPTLEHGYTFIYGIGVDNKLPVVTIPLAGVDTVVVDLTHIYNTTFTGISFYSLAVDYTHPPVNFERYTETDQQRILQRMKMIQESYNAQE